MFNIFYFRHPALKAVHENYFTALAPIDHRDFFDLDIIAVFTYFIIWLQYQILHETLLLLIFAILLFWLTERSRLGSIEVVVRVVHFEVPRLIGLMQDYFENDGGLLCQVVVVAWLWWLRWFRIFWLVLLLNSFIKRLLLLILRLIILFWLFLNRCLRDIIKNGHRCQRVYGQSLCNAHVVLRLLLF